MTLSAVTSLNASTPASTEAPRSDAALMLILRLAALLCLAGWTWVHFYWEGPYRILLWHDGSYRVAQWLGITWDEFVGTGANDGWLQRWMGRISWLYLASSLAALVARRRSTLAIAMLMASSGLLTILVYAKYIESQYQLPMLVEHGGQILAPLLLALALKLGARYQATIAVAVFAVITTFAGHGAYAIGWWPTPGNFYAMIALVLDAEYETATRLLQAAGILDFAVCGLIFVPRLRTVAVGYAAIWGLLTSLARPVAGMSLSLNYWGADQYLHEAIVRAPHALIPLYLFVLWIRPGITSSSATETP